jgi:dolichol-phosphate mannosyltransferase
LLSIIIPTYNESENIKPQVQRICKVLKEPFEILIVDDNSPDGTGKIADNLAKKYPVRVIHRTGKRGLATSCIDGFKEANGDIIGVMDADQSHPPELLPEMLKAINDGAEIAVASRKVGKGKTVGWGFYRHLMSWFASALAWPLTSVKDKTAGYFVFQREAIKGKHLNPIGYKIMLEVVVRSRSKRVVEVPVTFINRKEGKSKTNLRIQMQYLRHLGRLYLFKIRSLFSAR